MICIESRYIFKYPCQYAKNYLIGNMTILRNRKIFKFYFQLLFFNSRFWLMFVDRIGLPNAELILLASSLPIFFSKQIGAPGQEMVCEGHLQEKVYVQAGTGWGRVEVSARQSCAGVWLYFFARSNWDNELREGLACFQSLFRLLCGSHVLVRNANLSNIYSMSRPIFLYLLYPLILPAILFIHFAFQLPPLIYFLF